MHTLSHVKIVENALNKKNQEHHFETEEDKRKVMHYKRHNTKHKMEKKSYNKRQKK